MSERRKASYKKGLNGDDARRRRGETSVRIRKNKREEGLQKRRARMDDMVAAGDGAGLVSPSQPAAAQAASESELPRYAAELNSADPDTVRHATRAVRKLLSVTEQPPVLALMEAGALPPLVASLARLDDPELIFEATWALTNVASTQYTNVVVDAGAVPPLVALLLHAQANLREQAAWCLGNIAGDSTPFRDQVLAAGAMDALLANVAQPSSASMLKNVVWALSNFCRGKPQPHLAMLQPAVPVLLQCMSQHQNEAEVLMDASWALSYICDGDEDRIEAVSSAGAVPFLVAGVAHSDTRVVVPSLRSLGNVVSGSHTQTQTVVNAGVLGAAVPLLRSEKRNVRKEACWMLSNIAAGTPEQVAALVAAPGVLKLVVDLMSGVSAYDVRKEAAWVVSNVVNGGSSPHLQLLADLGVVSPLCSLLEAEDPKMVLVVLDTLELFLKEARVRGSDHIVLLVDECGGIDTLEKLQEHRDEKIYAKAVAVIEGFFCEEADGEDENLAPRVDANANAFAFGLAEPGKAVFDFGQTGASGVGAI